MALTVCGLPLVTRDIIADHIVKTSRATCEKEARRELETEIRECVAKDDLYQEVIRRMARKYSEALQPVVETHILGGLRLLLDTAGTVPELQRPLVDDAWESFDLRPIDPRFIPYLKTSEGLLHRDNPLLFNYSITLHTTLPASLLSRLDCGNLYSLLAASALRSAPAPGRGEHPDV